MLPFQPGAYTPPPAHGNGCVLCRSTKSPLAGRYDLAAVLTHKGRSADSGHYVAWVKQSDGKWIQFDDDKVRLYDFAGLAGLFSQ